MNAIVSKADLDDRRWFDERLATLREGVGSAHDIFLNWTENRNVSRFANGQTYGEFMRAYLGYDLPLEQAFQIMPGASTREIAKVAGVHHSTVAVARAVGNPTPAAEPARVIGADGKSYPGRVVREVTAEVIEPGEEPAKEARGPQRSRLTITEVRQQVRILQGVLAMLQPDEVVPAAHPVLREFAPALMSWVQLWGATE